MNGPPPQSVSTVKAFLDWTGNLVTPAESFAFRGQKNCEWELECGASRRLKTFDDFRPEETTEFQDKFLQYHRARLIRRARHHGFASHAGRELGDLEVLAKLQHLGAATCLLDFTRNALVALWMACGSEKCNGVEVNGKVSATQLSDRNRFRKLSQVDAREIDNIRNILSSHDGFRSNMFWYWEPPMVEDIAPRIIRQHSIFVFGHPILSEDSVRSIEIAGHAKQEILEELELQHGLSSESLFQDMFGFSAANDQFSELKAVETSYDYYCRGTQAYNQDNYEAAIFDYTEAVYLKPTKAELFVSRAHARASLAQSRGDKPEYERAIEDYDRAVSLVAQIPYGKDMIVHTAALHNRANVRILLKDFDGAIRDYSECIKLEKDVEWSGGNPYYNRGNTYCRIEQWDKAVLDYKEAISRGQQVRDSHYNLANVYVIMDQYENALQHYDQAIELDIQFGNALINRSTARALAGDIETAMQEYTKYGGLVNNQTLVAQALSGDETIGSMTLIGNTGNTGNVGLQGIEGPKGGKGFPGSGAFGKRYRFPTQ